MSRANGDEGRGSRLHLETDWSNGGSFLLRSHKLGMLLKDTFAVDTLSLPSKNNLRNGGFPFGVS